ncbi:putative inorganic phosphate cotransporter isoform X2 [Macrobrachium rosenbergii]|uniref:putative inorganic phosphate cotransporter isoform X2 n=1 Tax=Macrobrachium rosenbergii TaxID=79674 RepID=UPI0034D3DBEC
MDKGDEMPRIWRVSSAHSVDLPDDRHNHPTREQNGNRGWTDRHTLVLMTCTGQCIAYMTRGCLSVAIVAMVSSNSSSTHSAEKHADVCPVPTGANYTRASEKEGEFDWDEQLQGLVLGSYFYGYVSSCFFGGLVADYFGGRLMYGVSNVGFAILSVLSPISARTSVGLFIANKVISGVIQSPLYPSLNSLMASRIPAHLRAKYNSICLAGDTMGNVFSMALGGVLASSSFLGGWPSVFYVFGAAGILWGILWFTLIKEDPKTVALGKAADSENRNMLQGVNLKRVLTSLPFWGLVAFHTGDSFGYFMLSSEIPTYLSNIQYLDLNENGLLSALPYLLQSFFSMAWGIAINRLITSGRISILASRRISSAVGMYGAGLALVAMCFVSCNTSLAVGVLSISVGITGASISGGYLGEQDMCPASLVGLITGLRCMVSSTTGFIAPLVTGSIIAGNETLSAWRTAFLIAAALYFIPGTVYQICVTEKVQPWIKKQEGSRKHQIVEATA